MIRKGVGFPFQLWGSGFVVSPKGYIMTAAHVSDRCLESIGCWGVGHGVELERAAFFAKRAPDGNFHFYAARIEPRVFRPYMIKAPQGNAKNPDLDVAVFNTGQKEQVQLDHEYCPGQTANFSAAGKILPTMIGSWLVSGSKDTSIM